MTASATMKCKICQSDNIRLLYPIHRPDDAFELMECRACGMHFIDYLDPDFIPALPSLGDTIEEAASVISAGLESNHERIDRNVALLQRHAPRGAVLDIGCGAGAFLQRIQGSYDRVVGAELDPRYIQLARSRQLEIIDQPLESAFWDGQAGSFDAVTLWDVIEHVNDPVDFARRARALLKPGGTLLMDTPNRDGMFYQFGETTAKLTKGRVLSTMGIQYSAHPYCHKQIFRKSDMRNALSAAGFCNVELHERFELSFPPEYYTRRLIPSRFLRKMVNPIATAAFSYLPVRNKLIVAAS